MLELKEKIGTLEKSDVKIATIMALAMGTFFIYIGRLPLAVTFIPGLVITLTLIYFMYAKQLEEDYDEVLCYGIAFFKKRCMVKNNN